MNLLTRRPSVDTEAHTRVRGWVREALGLAEHERVVVTELACSEPGCPPLETVIAVFPESGPAFQRKVHRALAELTRHEVTALVASASNEENHDDHA